MLTEEALILLTTLGATGLLVLGVLELAWPSTPRKPVRPKRPAASPRREDAIAAPSAAPLRVPVADPVTPARPLVIETAVAAPAPVRAVPSPVAPPVPVVLTAAPERIAAVVPPVAPAAPSAVPPIPTVPPVLRVPDQPVIVREPRARVLPIDTCRAMYDEQRFAEVVSLGSAALEIQAHMAPVSQRPEESAALWDIVGLARQALGDRDGARAAFSAAVAGGAAAERPTYVGHLVALVRGFVEATADAEPAADTGALHARVRQLQSVLSWLDEAAIAAPADADLAVARGAVRDAFSTTCERLVARVVSGEGDDEARAVVLEALDDDTMPATWREGLREQLAAAFSAEIGQLTAQAIRSVQDGRDGDAEAGLARAERLCAALPAGAVGDERREEFERRLWWGYTKVGIRRLETKKFEDALDPLFRAMHLGGIDEDRLSETRAALVQALDGLVDVKWSALQKLGADDPQGAQIQVDKLWALLRSTAEQGIRQDDLAEAFAKVMHLSQTLQRPKE